MAVYDELRHEMVVRLVYDGPPAAGKTSSLYSLLEFLPAKVLRQFLSSDPLGARTQIFDWLELPRASLKDGPQRLRCQLIAVPGQIEYSARRRTLLALADAVVFVTGSSEADFAVSRQALRELTTMVSEEQRQLAPVGFVLQANKQDLPGALPPAEVARRLGLNARLPVVGTSAKQGETIHRAFLTALRFAAQRARTLMSNGKIARAQRVQDAQDLYDQLLESETFDARRDDYTNSADGFEDLVRSYQPGAVSAAQSKAEPAQSFSPAQAPSPATAAAAVERELVARPPLSEPGLNTEPSSPPLDAPSASEFESEREERAARSLPVESAPTVVAAPAVEPAPATPTPIPEPIADLPHVDEPPAPQAETDPAPSAFEADFGDDDDETPSASRFKSPSTSGGTRLAAQDAARAYDSTAPAPSEPTVVTPAASVAVVAAASEVIMPTTSAVVEAAPRELTPADVDQADGVQGLHDLNSNELPDEEASVFSVRDDEEPEYRPAVVRGRPQGPASWQGRPSATASWAGRPPIPPPASSSPKAIEPILAPAQAPAAVARQPEPKVVPDVEVVPEVELLPDNEPAETAAVVEPTPASGPTPEVITSEVIEPTAIGEATADVESPEIIEPTPSAEATEIADTASAQEPAPTAAGATDFGSSQIIAPTAQSIAEPAPAVEAAPASTAPTPAPAEPIVEMIVAPTAAAVDVRPLDASIDVRRLLDDLPVKAPEAGNAWPPMAARTTLNTIIATESSNSPAAWSQVGPDAVEYRGKAGWRLFTRPTAWRYTSRDEGRRELMPLVRRCVAMESSLPSGKLVVLAAAAGGFRLWEMTPDVASVADRVRALPADRRSSERRRLSSELENAATRLLTVAATAGADLDLRLDTVALTDVGPIYLGRVAPAGETPRPQDEIVAELQSQLDSLVAG